MAAGSMMAGWIAALALSPLGPPQAATAQPCTPPPLPADLAGWRQQSPVAAGAAVAGAPTLTVGRGARAALIANDAVRYARQPDKPGAAGNFGGLFAVTVIRAGRYRIALGGGAWIDVVQGDRALASVAHDHGPACSPIRKMVDFDLAPGRYLLQIAGSTARELPVMVAMVRR
jgi:hypothetical protein